MLEGFGHISDEDESLKGKGGSSFRFGLNLADVTAFSYNPALDTRSGPLEVIELEIDVNGSKQKTTIFNPATSKIFGKGPSGKNTELQPTDANYPAAFKANMNAVKGFVTHIVKSFGVTEADIQAKLVTPPTSFGAWAQVMTSFFKPCKVHLFMEYQNKIPEGYDMAFLQIPKNMKGGYWICPVIPGEWKMVEEPDGAIHYADGTGNKHPFTRDDYYMAGNKGTQLKTEKKPVNDLPFDDPAPLGGGANPWEGM